MKYTIIPIFVIAVIVVGILMHIFFALTDVYISNIGSLASIIGSIIAIHQILLLRDKTNEVNKAIEDTKAKMFFSSLHNNQTILNTMIDEIEVYVRDQKVESTLLKLKQLNDELKKIKAYISGGKYPENYLSEIESLIRDLSIYINQLSHVRKLNDIDWSNLTDILENIKSILIDNINSTQNSTTTNNG